MFNLNFLKIEWTNVPITCDELFQFYLIKSCRSVGIVELLQLPPGKKDHSGEEMPGAQCI